MDPILALCEHQRLIDRYRNLHWQFYSVQFNSVQFLILRTEYSVPEYYAIIIIYCILL